MDNYPYLPIWVERWFASTRYLSHHERGLYIDLLMLIWTTPGCRVPNDTAWLAKRMSMTESEVESELRPIIKDLCQSTGNWVTSEYLKQQVSYAKNRTQKATVAANRRWNNNKNNSGASSEQCSNDALLNTKLKTKKESKEVSIPPAADSASTVVQLEGKYHYENGPIRLNERDYNRWVAAYPHVNLLAELEALAGWQELTAKNWFHAVAAVLAKREREAATQIVAAKAEGEARVNKPKPKISTLMV